MKKLKELEEAEQILTELDVQDLIEPAIYLPIEQTKMQPLYGKKYVLVNYQTGFIPSKTYMCVFEDGQFVWKLINYTEEGLLDAPTNVWAKSTRDVTTGRATVYIHWDDPEDKEDVHWQYSVIVKKKGSAPNNIYDGQVVGYSSIRDQYAGKTGFVDSVDIDTVDDRDILDGTIIQTKDEDRYWYKIFAVTRYGKSTGSDAFLGELTWTKLQELIRAGVAHYAIEIGDIVQVKHNSIGVIPFQVVAFDNAYAFDPNDKTFQKLSHSVTFMSYDVLFRGSFDHKEELFAESMDKEWSPDPRTGNIKTYYEKAGDQWKPIDTSEQSLEKYSEGGKKPYERNPCWIDPNQQPDRSESNASIFGCNSWAFSNSRTWLNMNRKDEEISTNWFTPRTIWDRYSDNLSDKGPLNPGHGGYGFPGSESKPYTLFTGFYEDLESELKKVMAKVDITFTKPLWLRTSQELADFRDSSIEPDDKRKNPVEHSQDFIFLPSYAELFGVTETYPSDVFQGKDEHGNKFGEGTQFDIYKNKIADTYAKHIMMEYNTTTTSVPNDPDNHLASWYMRTPMRIMFHDPGLGHSHKTKYYVDCIGVVSSDSVQYDNLGGLGAIGGSGTVSYVKASGTQADRSGTTDVPRDVRNNFFKPTGSTRQYTANTTPGFAPCFVVG